MSSELLQSIISQIFLKKPGGGQVAAHEIMMGTSAIRNLIREDRGRRCIKRYKQVPV